MGYYIQTDGNSGKAQYLVKNFGGTLIHEAPASYSEIPEGKALVVVLVNPLFEAAGFCYNEQEFDDFTDKNDRRPRMYVLLDRQKAEELSGYASMLKARAKV